MRTFFVLTILLFALFASGALASTTALTIDGTDGIVSTPDGNFAPAGGVIKFHLRYTNLSDSGFNVQNYFKLFSPDGASWTDSAFGNFHGASLGPIGIDTTGLLSRQLFPTVYSLRTFAADTGTPVKADGISPDYLRFSGAGADIGLGLPPHTDVRNFSIIMQTNMADTGRTICLDSTWSCSSCGSWRWAVLYGGGSGDYVDPEWSGLICVKLVHPSAMVTPVMQVCPEGISGSHCGSSNYTYEATAPGGGPLEVRYNLWTGPGSLDSMTGVWTGTDLAPGAYDIAVNARNTYSGLYAITCWSQVVVTNQPPVFTPAMMSLLAEVGQTRVATPTITNDCDELTFTLLDNAGVNGPVSLNPSSGELSFTPSVQDSVNGPITMKVEVTDGISADTLWVVWRFGTGCVGTVGNVDCDAIEGVDIGDLTTLIDNLFITFTPLCASGEANCDGDVSGNVDIGDLTELINNLFITFAPLPACQ